VIAERIAGAYADADDIGKLNRPQIKKWVRHRLAFSWLAVSSGIAIRQPDLAEAVAAELAAEVTAFDDQ
jgi:hypothetical protein